MKRSRLTTGTVAAVALVFVGALAGCSPAADTSEPPISITPTETPSSTPVEETVAPNPGDPYMLALEETLTGVTLVGEFGSETLDDRSLEFTFAEDGTLDFADFGGEPRNNPNDVWSVDETHIYLTISEVMASVMGRDGSMEDQLIDYGWSAEHKQYQENGAVTEEEFTESVLTALESDEGLLWSTQSGELGQATLTVTLKE